MIKRCAFSGHRPFYFPWKGDENDPGCMRLKEKLAAEIDLAIEDGFNCFITGGAEGVDTWAAEIVLERRRQNPSITLELAKPYAGYNSSLQGSVGDRLRAVEEAADHITIISDGADELADCILRDCYMVDASERLIVVYDDESMGSSGTKDTLLYAKASGIDIRQIQWRHFLTQ